jgi:hypothetical protein
MKLFIPFILFSFLSNAIVSHAQQIDTVWTKTFGGADWDNAASVHQTDDGGYILAGFTESLGNGPRDLWLVKTNDMGDTLWTRTYGGSNQENGYQARQTAEGGYVVVGQTNSFNSAGYDLYFLRLNAAGDTAWTKTYGGSGSDNGRDIKIVSTGGYIISGSLGSDAWILRTNESGDTLWTTIMDQGESEVAESVCEAPDGGFVAVGATGAFGVADVYLIKVNNIGDSLWAKTFGGPGYDWGHAILGTSEGGYIVVGTTQTFGAGDNDIWLLRMDASGDTLWTRTIGTSETERGFSISNTADGGYIISGMTNANTSGGDDGFIIKTDSAGTVQWSKSIGGMAEEWILSVEQTSDSGYIACGFTASFGEGNRDMWMLKFGPVTTGLENNIGTNIPNRIKLYQNYPNPFNPETVISYQLSAVSLVILKVYDIEGREVAELVNGIRIAGGHTVKWDASNVVSGVYFYRLETGQFAETRKMILIR